MSLLEHAKFQLELATLLARAATLHIRIKECKADQQMCKYLAAYPTPDGLNIDYAEKQRKWKDELQLILDYLVCNYRETSLSTLKCFYFPSDAEDVANYGRELIDWISDIRKHLIQLKAETTKMLRDKEKDSDISNDSSLPSFQILSYEQRLKKIYHSVVRFEQWLKIESKPVPSEDLPDARNISHVKPNDSAALTERLDKIRSALTAFQASRPESLSSFFQIHQKYHLELFRPQSLSSHFANAIYQTVNKITSESLPLLLSTAKAGCQEALIHNEPASHTYLGQRLFASFGLIEIVLGITNAALTCMLEDGKIRE